MGAKAAISGPRTVLPATAPVAALAGVAASTAATAVSSAAPAASSSADGTSLAAAKVEASPLPPARAVADVPMTMGQFLDRLMIAESGGRLDVKNPRSTALGPFQFIESTFLAVAKRNFAAEIADKTPEQILALRTDLAFSRKAAEAYTRENAAVLKSYGVEPTYPNLRMAFLLGAHGAAKVLKAPPVTPLAQLLAPAVLVANPFMASMTAHGLTVRSAREVWQPVTTTQGVVVPPGTQLPRRVAAVPIVPVVCNIKLPSCKRWVALQTAKVRARPAAKSKAAQAAGKQISETLSNLGGPKAGPR